MRALSHDRLLLLFAPVLADRIRAAALAALLATLVPVAGQAKPTAAAAERGGTTAANPPPDLVRLVTCGGTMKDYGAFALKFSDELARAWGWKAAPSTDSLLKVYTLPNPLTVFGEKATRLALSGSGVVALLSVPVRDLARRLGLRPIAESGATLIFGKTVHEARETDKASGTTISEKISLSVSTSDSFAGTTLAGCSYVLDVN
jgi:hypothetical protein